MAGADSVPDFAGSVFGALFPALTRDDVTSPPTVRLFRFDALATSTPAPSAEFVAGSTANPNGVRVGGSAAGEFDVVTAPGGGGGDVQFWSIDGDTATLVRSLAPFEPGFLGSVYVGG